MREAGQGAGSERRVVTVLFADIAGFTAMSENLDPETVTDAVNEIFTVLGAEVEAVGGHVDKVIGDSLMALFGAPTAHEDDALRAVRAALKMQRAMKAREEVTSRLFGQPVRLRIGLHSGLVVWGSVGPPGQARPTVMGDAVNLASRLQRSAPEGGVLVTEVVWRQVRGHYLSKTWEPIVVKGKAEPVAVYEIVGERDRAEPVARPPFVDRRDELQQLEDLKARALRGRAQVAIVVGDPGVGKTRLIEEFTRRLSPEVALLQTACPPYGGNSLGPLADLFRQLTGLAGTVTLKEVEARIPLGERTAQAASVVSRLFGLAEVPPGDDVSHETALLVAAEVVRRLLTRPTVVWIEDLQWVDAGTRELLPFMMERLLEVPLLLIGSLRPDAEVVAWGKRSSSTTIQLEPLTDDAARQFLAGLTGEHLPEPIERVLVEKAGGNPFYLNEIVAMLRSAGLLVQDDHGRWRATGSIEHALPDTVQAAVLARLDRLPADLRAIVQRAAVVGASFPRSLLGALSPGVDMSEGLRAVEDAGIVRLRDPLAADPEYAFVHPLVREVAYGTLLAKQQVALHRHIAEAMERLYPEQIEELAKTIGTHHARGGHASAAVPYLVRAGEQADRRFATREAIELFEWARRLAVETGQTDLCIVACERLGELYLRVQDRGPKAWFDVWEFVRAHVDPKEDPVRAARAAIRAAYARAHDNQVANALDYLKEAEPLLPADHPLWSDYHRVRSFAYVIQSEYRPALEAARQAVDIATRVGTLQDRSRAYAALAHPAILPLLGDEGRRVMRQAAAEATAAGDERLLIEARHFLLSDVWTRSVVDHDVLRTAEEAVRKTEEYGWTRDEAALSMILGWAQFLTGEWAEAGRHLARAHELIDTHDGRLQGTYHILLPHFRANLAMGQGQTDDARQILERALVHAAYHQPIWLNHDMAQCQLMLGDLPSARAAMEQSLRAVDRLRCIICGCQAHGVGAEFYAAIGEVGRAEALAREAEDTAREIGHVATQIRVLRARALIALAARTPEEAIEAAQRAVALGWSMPLPQPLEIGQSLLVLGSAQRAAGQSGEATASWREARGLFEGLGATWYLQQVRGALQQVGVG